MKRGINILIIITLLLTIVHSTALAQVSIILDPIPDKQIGDKVTIMGITDITGNTNIKVIHQDGTIKYADEISIINGAFNKEIILGEGWNVGTYEVVVGKGNVVANTEFKVVSSAQASITLDPIPDKQIGERVTIKGIADITGNINIKVIHQDGTIKYADEISIINGAFNKEFVLGEGWSAGTYKVVVGKGNVVVSTEIKVVDSTIPDELDYNSGDRNINDGSSAITIKEDTIFVKGKLSDDGVVKAKVTERQLNNVFKNAKKDKDGSSIIKIEIEEEKETREYIQQLPFTALSKKVADKKIIIKTGFGTIAVPSNMMNHAGIKESSVVELGIGLADEMAISEKLKAEIGDRPIVKFSVGVNDEKIAWDNPEAPVVISMDYVPTSDELGDPEHLVVLHINESRNIVPVPSGRFNPITGKITFTTTHFGTYAVSFVHKTFSDTTSYGWAERQINVLASKGVINGTSDTTYSPGEDITRADFIKLLVRGLGLTAKVNSNFNDINIKDYYYDEVGIAKKLGIISGVGGNRFNPKAKITRQDMMVMVYNALKFIDKSAVSENIDSFEGFSDISEISEYAKTSIAALVEAKMVQGYGGKINPLGKTNRAEAAVLLYEVYNK